VVGGGGTVEVDGGGGTVVGGGVVGGGVVGEGEAHSIPRTTEPEFVFENSSADQNHVSVSVTVPVAPFAKVSVPTTTVDSAGIV
jgi:hypothetical protein